MSTGSNVAALKEHFEQLFPGKWLLKGHNQRNLQTGLLPIDTGPSRGIARKRISEWLGAPSSGKSSVLRFIVAQWCAAGLHVVYVDAANRLSPGDWAFVTEPQMNFSEALKKYCAPTSLTIPGKQGREADVGRFWVVRNLVGRNKQEALWATEQLVRSSLFDVVIFDVANTTALQSRFYARLQRSLDSSKSALVIMKDEDRANSNSASWGCHTRFYFRWSNSIATESGLSGIAAISPAVRSSIWKDGLNKSMELAFDAYATNRLFTHPQIPDRRARQARTTIKK